MAWGGSPLVSSLGTRLVIVTGASLANGASGTISNPGGGGDIVLPSNFPALTGLEFVYFWLYEDPAAGAPVFAYRYTGGIWTVKNLDPVNATNTLRGYVKSWFSMEM